MKRPADPSLFNRLLLGFSGVTLFVALCGFVYVAWEARETQRSRTASENSAHARELLMHLADVADFLPAYQSVIDQRLAHAATR